MSTRFLRDNMDSQHIITPGSNGTMIRRYTTATKAVIDLQRIGAKLEYRYKETIVATYGPLKIYARIGGKPKNLYYAYC